MNKKELKIGDKVHYKPSYFAENKWKNGIIKSFASDGDPFIVFNCGEDWHNYQNYTAAKTPIKDVYPNWGENA